MYTQPQWRKPVLTGMITAGLYVESRDSIASWWWLFHQISVLFQVLGHSSYSIQERNAGFPPPLLANVVVPLGRGKKASNPTDQKNGSSASPIWSGGQEWSGGRACVDLLHLKSMDWQRQMTNTSPVQRVLLANTQCIGAYDPFSVCTESFPGSYVWHKKKKWGLNRALFSISKCTILYRKSAHDRHVVAELYQCLLYGIRSFSWW